MDKVQLLEDVVSVFKGRVIYGRKNDLVKIISEQGGVLIVEGSRWIEEKGKYTLSGIHRYSINKNQIK